MGNALKHDIASGPMPLHRHDATLTFAHQGRGGGVPIIARPGRLRSAGPVVYIPPDFSTITPYFFVAEAEGFVAFLVDGLGGKGVCRTRRADGRIANVQADGDRQGGVKDRHGNIWWISQRTVHEPYSP
jgi:hypothetical protein